MKTLNSYKMSYETCSHAPSPGAVSVVLRQAQKTVETGMCHAQGSLRKLNA
jgi:hypothetical protein